MYGRAFQTRSFQISRTATAFPLRNIPAFGELGDAPGRVRLELLPAGRPRPVGEHQLGVTADRGDVDEAECARRLELVLVLPLYAAVGPGDQVELVVDRVVRDRAPS